MINEWKSWLIEHAAEWGVSESANWSFLFYNNYQPNCTDMDILWFRDGELRPRVVTKVSREPDRPGREFAGLQRVHAVAPASTPRPLHFGPQGRFWTLWMEAVPGGRFEGRETPEVLAALTETVAGIHAPLRETRQPRPDLFRDIVAEPLRLLREFGNSAAVAEGCRALLARLQPEWVAALPSIPQHGDLYDGNLLHRNGAWYVIDWETFGIIDLPAYDLFTILLSSLLRDGAACSQWNPALAAEMPRVVRLYAQKLGLSEADLRLLLPLTLANWFYLQAKDGRERFSAHKYPAIVDYFENTRAWEKVFFSEASA